MQNPEIANGMPQCMANEYFVLSRNGMAFSAKRGNQKVEGSGTLFLSTLRMVFVVDGNRALTGFDIPLATLENEKFNQPIFGANNLTGDSPPLDAADGEKYKWCLSFRNGGVGTFLPFFFRLLTEMRQRMRALSGQAPQADPSYTPVFDLPTSQGFVQTAFVDPGDPTTFYVPSADGGPPVAVAR